MTELRLLIEAHLDDTGDGIAGLQLFSTTETGAPTSAIAEASLAFVAQGAKQIVVGSFVLDYGPGDYLVVPVDLPITGRFTLATRAEPFVGLGLTLDTAAVTALILEGPPHPNTRTGATHPVLGTSRAPAGLIDALIRLVGLLDESPLDRDVLAPMVQREILWRVLRGPHGHLLRSLVSRGSALAHVGEATRWIREHYAEPFRVHELAERLAVSTSTLHRQFLAATTMGPINYQKKIRLQQARIRLCSSDADVITTAHRGRI